MINSTTHQATAKTVGITGAHGETAVNYAMIEEELKKNMTTALEMRKLEDIAHVGVRELATAPDPLRSESKFNILSNPVI